MRVGHPGPRAYILLLCENQSKNAEPEYFSAKRGILRQKGRDVSVKIAVRMAVCGVLAATAVTMAAYTAADFRRANAARAAGYTLAASDGYVAVYAGQERKTPLRVTEIELATLRETDRALIEDGLHAASREEVLQILEDLGT